MDRNNPTKALEKSDDIQNIMTSVKWLIQELERIECHSLANLFQRTVDDAESWIHHMAFTDALPPKVESTIQEKEAAMIHTILVKYASIHDHQARKKVIEKMMHSIESALLTNH